MALRKAAASRKKKPSPGITRAEILHKYWELANLDPEATKGTITGQLKALELLADQLDWASDASEGRATPPAIYRAAWLDPVVPNTVRPTAKDLDKP